MSLKLEIHTAGNGMCSLHKKQTEGFFVTFEDGTVTKAFLGSKALIQLFGEFTIFFRTHGFRIVLENRLPMRWGFAQPNIARNDRGENFVAKVGLNFSDDLVRKIVAGIKHRQANTFNAKLRV